ncbi:MAG: CDP-alcohol phosphatidyltransferase family protein [Methylocystaceae bacterium]|nr:CDP-alcohol phosphatidyltransferase family protein [Methylocystaceae bacterium]
MSQQFWLNVPNLLTLGRIIAVPFIVWLVLIHQLNWAFWVFIGAGVSDGLDGYLAKVMNAQTKIGALLDPIADKFLLVCVFVVLGVQGFLPIWLVILVAFRDFAIVMGATLIEIMTHNLTMSPNFSSKLNTSIQIVLASCVLGVHGLQVESMMFLIDGLIYVTALTTAISGAIYLYQWGQMITQVNGD